MKWDSPYRNSYPYYTWFYGFTWFGSSFLGIILDRLCTLIFLRNVISISLTRLEISVEIIKSSTISSDLENSVKFSSLPTVSLYWYFLITSMSFHESLHVNTNKHRNILIFGFKILIFESKTRLYVEFSEPHSCCIDYKQLLIIQ